MGFKYGIASSHVFAISRLLGWRFAVHHFYHDVASA
jgi:hypothetical protein